MSTATTIDAERAFDGLGMTLRGPLFAVVADGERLDPTTMERAGDVWRRSDVTLRLVGEQTPDGSRSVRVELTGVRHVDEVCLFDYDVEPAPIEIYDHAWFIVDLFEKSTAIFIRGERVGVFASTANPFGRAEIEGNHVRVWYRPGLDVEGTFVSDPLVVGPVALEGRPVRREAMGGRDTVKGEEVRGVSAWPTPIPTTLDAGEIRAVREAVAARTPWEPARMAVSHWDWGANLFRLDPADPATHDVYAREAAVAREIGVDYFLFAPGFIPGGMQSLEQAITHMTGPWQAGMWLAMGEDVGHGCWQAGKEPPGVLDLLGAARSAGLKLAMYTNPQYDWLQDPDWQVLRRPIAYVGDESPVVGEPESISQASACLGSAAACEYLIGRLGDFVRTYELSGVALDFVEWLECHSTGHGHTPGPDSRYAQWDGYRRVLAALREMGVEWVEGLIGSQSLMPWGSVNMTHPHPLMCDNQPQWQAAWPDLSQYRTMGNYQRRIAYFYRNFGLMPTYKIPGQVGHQSNRVAYGIPDGYRYDPAHPAPNFTRFFPQERGWDWNGARFNLLSAIGSAPNTLSVCFLPGWDAGEATGMLERDGAFFARWIDFARQRAELLSGLEDLFDEPRPGAVDGTIALDEGGRGLCFLANPDFIARQIAVDRLGSQLLRELHPIAGRLWRAGRVEVDPHEIAVYDVLQPDDADYPALIGVAGRLDDDGHLVAARGRPGSTVHAIVAGGSDAVDDEFVVHFAEDGVAATLGPWRDEAGRPVEIESLTGSTQLSTTWVPGVALAAQLARLAPPISPEGDEQLRPWSDPSRLRLIVELIDPQRATVRARVNGVSVQVRAAYIGTYSDVRDPNLGTVNHLLAYYLDLADELGATDPSQPWTIEFELDGLQPGMFRGVHVAELPERLTDRFSLEGPPSPASSVTG